VMHLEGVAGFSSLVAHLGAFLSIIRYMFSVYLPLITVLVTTITPFSSSKAMARFTPWRLTPDSCASLSSDTEYPLGCLVRIWNTARAVFVMAKTH
ncbi:hypothetical protein, partial [Escherichia coli]|uniref:hypothetical protein n=1 Tax=Escherichia coli TaxID=562 RepID=UPI003D80E32F